MKVFISQHVTVSFRDGQANPVSTPALTNLQVTYTQGAPPNLFLQDAAGTTIEEVSIANWKREHIDEYLAEKLSKA